MVVLGINSRAACFSHFHSRHCEINFFERRRRAARIDAENGHRRGTRPRLRIIIKETRGYPTSYLRSPSGTVKYGLGPLKVSVEYERSTGRFLVYDGSTSGVRAEYERSTPQAEVALAATEANVRSRDRPPPPTERVSCSPLMPSWEEVGAGERAACARD